jgi:hypothetical protein
MTTINETINIVRPGQGDSDGLYMYRFCGTYSATPLVVGIAARVLSVNPNLKAEQISQILRRSCDKIDPGNAHYDTNRFSISHGYGGLNARRALEITKEMT